MQLVFVDEKTMLALATTPPNEMNNLILKGKLIIKGNYAYISYFNFLMSVILKGNQIKQLQEQREKMKLPSIGKNSDVGIKHRKKENLKSPKAQRDKGVKFLEDQYLSEYSLQDFPRLERFLNIHYTQKPEVCAERPML